MLQMASAFQAAFKEVRWSLLNVVLIKQTLDTDWHQETAFLMRIPQKPSFNSLILVKYSVAIYLNLRATSVAPFTSCMIPLYCSAELMQCNSQGTVPLTKPINTIYIL